ncbi:MAG: hypothetical protein WD873_00905 [Candidatus Hydrogenedentales bacterium]
MDTATNPCRHYFTKETETLLIVAALSQLPLHYAGPLLTLLI